MEAAKTCLAAVAAVQAVHKLLGAAALEGQRTQEAVKLQAGPPLLAAHRQQGDHNLAEACCNLRVGTGHTLLEERNLAASVSNLMEGHNLLVEGHNQVVHWFEGVHSLLGGCHRLLLVGRILLGVDLVWDMAKPQGLAQDHMVTRLGQLETALEEGRRGWGVLEQQGSQQGVG